MEAGDWLLSATEPETEVPGHRPRGGVDFLFTKLSFLLLPSRRHKAVLKKKKKGFKLLKIIY